ncbi:MAG: retropepsin-like aspartic protease [Solirubrobacterales bacterium]
MSRLFPACLLAVVLLAACGGSDPGSALTPNTHPVSDPAPPPKPELPPEDEGCSAGEEDGEATVIPIKVEPIENLVTPIVNICFGEEGPYPLELDTGAATSAISTSLAEELGLKKTGDPEIILGAGCRGESQGYELPSWSVGGVPLEGGTITATDEPESEEGYPRGSLGADVLSRFGAIRIDYANEKLILPGDEGPEFEESGKPEPLPEALVPSGPEITAPMTAEGFFGEVTQTAEIALGETTATPWLIDTAAALSVAESSAVKAARLEPTDTAREGGTFCSTIVIEEYESGDWTLGGEPLEPEALGGLDLGSGGEVGGLLGSNTLYRFGSVVFDWDGGQLLLGVG